MYTTKREALQSRCPIAVASRRSTCCLLFSCRSQIRHPNININISPSLLPSTTGLSSTATSNWLQHCPPIPYHVHVLKTIRLVQTPRTRTTNNPSTASASIIRIRISGLQIMAEDLLLLGTRLPSCPNTFVASSPRPVRRRTCTA